ncbi:peptidase M23 [Microseira wollei NIES-4236]|uniref:Peptidase M23 n=2 Tax=Microseira wollei TaxID=467598 RepID=A0AAV3XPG0_9CYAN|nr:peptidoglycan DD-metalloendopeptidase family protein [Microseira wollei]GET43501.1 peptidase M23 [Microseira wollei NIES-4236]
MKRVLTQKVKPIPACAFLDRAAEENLKSLPSEGNLRVGRSAAMIGLAISVGASSLLLPQQGEGAMATEATDGSPVSTVPAPATSPAVGETQGQPIMAAAEIMPKQPAIGHQDREGQTIGSNTQTNQVEPTFAAETKLPALSATSAAAPRIPALMEKSQGISAPENPLLGIAPAILQRANGYSSDAASRDSFAARLGRVTSPYKPSVAQESSASVAATIPNPVNDLLKAKQTVAIDRLRDSSNRLRSSLAEWKSEESTNLPAQSTEPYQPYVPSYVNPVVPSQQESAEVVDGQVEALGSASVTEPATEPVISGIQPQWEQQNARVEALPQVVVPEPTGTEAMTAVYQVQPGDTLSGIAQHYGVTATVLAQANHIDNPHRLQIAQLLAIPQTEKGGTTLVANAQNLGAHLRETAYIRPGQQLPASASWLTNVAVPTKQRTSSTLALAVVPGLVIDPDRDRNLGPTVPLSDEASVPLAASGDANLGTDFAPPKFNGTGVKQLAVGEPEAKYSDAEDRSAIAAKPKQQNNPYIERLRAELSQLRDQYRNGQASFRHQTANAPAPSPIPAAPVNPEFDSRRYNQALQAEIERRAASERANLPQTPTLPRTQPPTVATAPLGAEPYQPFQPSRGQMVSPDLPPLGDPNQYLPGGSQNLNGLMWPTRGVLTSGYGRRWGRMHRGIDIAAPTGTPIFAAAPGVVVYARWNSGGYGNLVDIRHADGSLTRYGHNSRIFVQEGQVVEQGQHISAMGSTGFSTGPHLHFEIHPPGRGAVNPMAFLPRRR